MRSDERIHDDVVLRIGNDRFALPPIERAVGFEAFAVCEEVVLRLFKGDLVDQVFGNPVCKEVGRFLEAVVLHCVGDLTVDDDAVFEVVIKTEHAVQVALIALPVVIDKAQRAFVACIAVAVHVVVAEVAEHCLHLIAGEVQTVLQVRSRNAGNCARFDRGGSPVLIEEEDVRILQKSHLLDARQRVDLAVLDVDELCLDVGTLFEDLGEVGHVFKIVGNRQQDLALGVLDDLARAHTGVIDRVGTVVRVAEDQVFLLCIHGFGNILPRHEHVGAFIQILHDLHVVVIERGCVLGRIDAEREFLCALFIEDRGVRVGPLEAVFLYELLNAGTFLLVAALSAAAARDHRQYEEQCERQCDTFFHVAFLLIF